MTSCCLWDRQTLFLLASPHTIDIGTVPVYALHWHIIGMWCIISLYTKLTSIHVCPFCVYTSTHHTHVYLYTCTLLLYPHPKPIHPPAHKHPVPAHVDQLYYSLLIKVWVAVGVQLKPNRCCRAILFIFSSCNPLMHMCDPTCNMYDVTHTYTM